MYTQSISISPRAQDCSAVIDTLHEGTRSFVPLTGLMGEPPCRPGCPFQLSLPPRNRMSPAKALPRESDMTATHKTVHCSRGQAPRALLPLWSTDLAALPA